ncbi:hypothetical protein CBS101457_004403 [Exobasidium rhododendri]|nr:hypothetical protein CBS101457_004403 [Exobasidium rhododendri]
MQTTSLDRYESSQATTSTPSAQPYDRRRNKTSYSSTPLFASGIGTGYREQTHETSITILLWHTTPVYTSTSTLSKTPLLREVPQVKRKLNKRDRDVSVTVPETRSFQSLKSVAPSWLREKPSRHKLSEQINPAHQKRGLWKKATVICREGGVFLIYGEDRALLHSISTNLLSATDIRLVDESVYACANVLGIFSRPSTLTAGGSIRYPTPSVVKSTSQTSRDEPIYLCFPTSQKLKRWRGLMRTFSKPEIYGAPHKGGTHRTYRQVDLSIVEVKFAVEHNISSVRSSETNSSSFGDDDDWIASPTESGIFGNLKALSRRSVDDTHLHKENHGAGRSVAHSISTASFDLKRGGRSRVPSLDEDTNGDKKIDVKEDDSDDDDLDDESCGTDVVNGPISGISGRERIKESGLLTGRGQGFDTDRRRAPDLTRASAIPSACYCVVWMAGEVVAQTKVRSGLSIGRTWLDKFILQDLPDLAPIQIEVMQQGRNGRFRVIGVVDLPMNTVRRGENIHGWFPIWSAKASHIDMVSSPMESCTADEMLGEVKISITVKEENVLPLRKYAKLEESLHTGDFVKLMQTMCKELNEDQVVTHLVDIHTSKGSIVELLSNLTEVESATITRQSDLNLLFRGNTLLTRAVDKFQRKYCKDWLEVCIGPTVRQICHDRIYLEASDSHHYYASPIQVEGTGTIVGESNLDALQRLCRDLWKNIYANRHRCPQDLRSALSQIRNKVNLQFKHFNKAGPGIQGVGAFVFLRLICPAITTPNIYGLMTSKANEASGKTLMLVAKVFLALASKRSTFDQDKEPWLFKANKFLDQHATAYDDFITYISTEPPPKSQVKKEALGDEVDFAFQSLIQEKIDLLPELHRESIPTPEYMLDHALALSSLVSYVVRDANVETCQEEKILKRGAHQQQQQQQPEEGSGGAYADEPFDRFVDLCCDIEDQVGYYIDRAGYNPEPNDMGAINSRQQSIIKSTQIYTTLSQSQSFTGVTKPVAQPAYPQSSEFAKSGSTPTVHSRRATISADRFRTEAAASAAAAMIKQEHSLYSIGSDPTSSATKSNMPTDPVHHLETRLGGASLKGAKRSSGRDLDRFQSTHLSDSMGVEAIRNDDNLGEQRAILRGKWKKQSMDESSTVGPAIESGRQETNLPEVKRAWWKKS